MFSLDPRGGHNRYKFNKDFFKEWTPEMAYVLGFTYADGNITNAVSSRTQYFHVDSTDRDIIERIKSVLGAEHPISIEPSHFVKYNNGKVYRSADSFRLRIGSREIYNDLIKLGLTPKKSLTIKFPNNIPESYFAHFVRGYFDGDGCIHIKRGKGKYGQTILKGLSIIFTSGSKEFLEGLRDSANRFSNFGKKSVYYIPSSRAYYLKYDTAESLRWFKFFYGDNPPGLFLERKLNIFKEYFQLRPVRIDQEICSILKI